MSRRPEHQAPPEIFYNEEEARKYTQNTRMMEIQCTMCERCIELLVLPEDTPCYLLDIGCGSGLSGSVLEDFGHVWTGMDISSAMLVSGEILIQEQDWQQVLITNEDIYVALEREMEGDLVLSDMGQGVPFRAGTFDGAVSVSALQWLCNADKSYHKPIQRLYKFFSTLYASLSRTARAVFQFYPENAEQMELVTSQAMKAGFYGGVLVDYPNSTKAKKYFLVLMTGGQMPMPKALGTGASGRAEASVSYTAREHRGKNSLRRPLKKSRDWILEKKERRRKQGKETRMDTKYTGRKRSGRF